MLMSPLKIGQLNEKDLADAPQICTISGIFWDEAFKKA
jgi:hypothetical protein